MPIISIACSKGGVGKSTIATSLVVSLQQAGYSVALADCDIQFSASQWADLRDDQDFAKLHYVQKVGKVKTTIKDLSEKFDFVVVDTGGHDASGEMRQALTISDLVVVPLKTSQHDLNVIDSIASLIDEIKELGNEKLQSLYVLNMVNTSSRSKKLKEVKLALSEADDINLYKGALYNRDSYVQTASTGQGITELRDKKAKDEFLALTKYIIKKFKLSKYGIRKNAIKSTGKAKKAV